MKIIKISTELEMTIHEFPTGSYGEQNTYIRGLIGDDCELYEHVMPKRLYTELHHQNRPTKVKGQCVSMLIDEECLLKENVAFQEMSSLLERNGQMMEQTFVVSKKLYSKNWNCS